MREPWDPQASQLGSLWQVFRWTVYVILMHVWQASVSYLSVPVSVFESIEHT